MSYVPISRFPFQYFKLDGNPANGYYLKFYQANGSTPINMQTDSGGATSLAKCKLNEYGFPISNPNDNSTVFIPHLSTTYTAFRFVLYASAADADANNVTSGLPNIQSVGTVELDALRSDLAASSGSSLIGYINSISGSVARTVQARLRDCVCVKDFGTGLTADDSTAFANAISTGKRVYVPVGSYNISNVSLVSGTEIFGDGMALTIINVKSTGHYGFTCDSGSSSTANNIRNLKLTDLQMLGTVAANGFAQFDYLVNLNGVTDVIIQRCALNGFLGDGVYIGSSNTSGQERHNQRVKIMDCEFDGVNSDNRNAISVIDGDGIKIMRNTFKNCTRSNMPGAIDLEPDAYAFPIIKNVTIADNIFENVGGNVGAVGVQIPSTVTEDASNIKILRNTFINVANLFAFNSNRTPSTSTRENVVTFRDNVANTGTGRPLILYNVNRCTIENNDIYNFESSSLIGYTGGTDSVRDVEFIGNRFVRCGSTVTTGMNIFKADYVKFRRNKFIDCGNGAAGANAIDFNTGASSYIDFDDCNEFSAPTGKTLIAIQKEAGHTFSVATNRFYNAILNSLPNNFQAYDTDSIINTWTPVLTGSTSGTLAGTGTWTKVGNRYTVYGQFPNITTANKPIGNYTITGLPAAASSAQISAAIDSTDRVTFTTQPRTETRSSSTILDLVQPVSNANSVSLTDANFVNASTMSIRFTLSYTA